MTRDVPDDIVNAEPAGGWTSADPVDGGGADALAAVQEEAPDEETPTDAPAPTPAPDGVLPEDATRASDPYVESAEIQQGLDPDLLTDEQADR